MMKINRSFAVVIGINRYQNGITELQTAVNDARAVCRVLSDTHDYDDVHLLLDDDATLDGIRACLTENIPRKIQKDDRLLFYFAGHGIALDDDDDPVGFLVPQDAKQEDEDTFLPMQEVHDALLALDCRHMLAILDCCFAGAFRWATTRQLRVVQPRLYEERYQRYINDPAWQVITSAAHDQKALDLVGMRYMTGRRDSDGAAAGSNGPVQHSPFGEALLDALERGAADLPMPGNGVVTATDLYIYLRDQVESEHPAHGLRQTPGLWPLRKHDKGEYVFTFRDRLELPSAVELNQGNSPYRGLKAYDEEHSDLFFGRAALLQTLQTHVDEQPLTTVLGPSGVGKSSLVQAGLLPTLRDAIDPEWTVVDPIRPTQDPLGSLAELALPDHVRPDLGLLAVAAKPHSARQDAPAISATDLAQWLAYWFAEHPGQRLVLVIDQFEEIFTLCPYEDDRIDFLKLLVTAAMQHQERLRLILTLRSDFQPRTVQLLESAQLTGFDWAKTRFWVSPMNAGELRDVIEKPAMERVLYFEPTEFVDELVQEVVQMPGALPLLSFTLSELYIQYLESARENRTLTRTDYEALGSVVGALQHRADAEYGALDKDHQASMRYLMLRMVSLEGGEIARRRVSQAELRFDGEEQARVDVVVERLIAARLVVSAQDREEKTYVEPAHDALVRGWPKLSEWIDETEEEEHNLRFRQRLALAAESWLESTPGRTESRTGLLWSDDEQSGRLERFLNTERRWMNQREVEFSQKSIERNTVNRRIRRMAIAALIVLTVIAAAAAIFATNRQRAAVQSLRDEQISTSRGWSNRAIDQLTEDPVASLHLGLAALPNAGDIRPYLPESEFAATQALRTNQERAFMDFTDAGSDVALTVDQVAWSDEWIAVGGDGLYLVTPNFSETLTLTTRTTETVRGVAWSDNGLLLSRDDGQVKVWREGTRLADRPFEALIACAQWAPEGEQIAVCSGKRLWLWRHADNLLTRIPEFPTNVKDARWSPDGRFVAAWDKGNSLLVWNVATDSRLPIAEPDDLAEIWDVAWAEEGRHLVIADADGRARLVTVESPDVPQIMQVSSDGKAANVLFVDEERFVTWAEDSAHLWTVGVAEPYTLSLGADAVDHVLPFVEQGKLSVLTPNGAVQIWDLTGDQPIPGAELSGHDGKILDAAWDDSGQHMATSSNDGTVRIWHIGPYRAEIVTTLRGHTGTSYDERADVIGVRWQGAGYVVTYGKDGSLRRWQILDDTGEPVCNGELEGLPRCIDENATFYAHAGNIDSTRWLDNDRIITTGADGAAGRLDLSKEEPEVRLLLPESTDPLPPKVLWDPDGKRVFVYQRQTENPDAQDSAGLVRDFETGVEIAAVAGLIDTAFWLEGGLLVGDTTNNVRLINPQSGETIRRLEGYEGEIISAQQYRNRWLATGEVNGTIRVWNFAKDEAAPILLNADASIAEQLPVTGLQWSADGALLLSMGRSIMLWDVENRTKRWPFFDNGFNTTYAVFSPNEELVAVAIGSSIAVVDTPSGEKLWADEEEHDQPIRGISWLMAPVWPNQQASWRGQGATSAGNERSLLLTWSGDKTARLWDWQHDGEIMRMGDVEGIGTAAVSPDGARIVTTTGTFTLAGPQGIIRLWQTWHQAPDTLLQAVQDRITRPLTDQQRDRFAIK